MAARPRYGPKRATKMSPSPADISVVSPASPVPKIALPAK
jgi:hypothetical protein